MGAIVELLVPTARQGGLLCDFDGTLAPIVPEPAAARALPGAVELLHRLAGRLAVVAVVSGRPGPFLAEQLWADPPPTPSGLLAFGLYGNETVTPPGTPPVPIDPVLAHWSAAVRAAAEAIGPSMPPGTLLEPKRFSLGLHWRNAPDAEPVVLALAERAASEQGLELHHGRMAAELLPPVPVDKGSVVARLTEGLRAAAFVGDDVGDLPAFAALESRSDAGELEALKVAVNSNEAPPALLDRADVVLDGPAQVLELLRALDAALSP